MNVMHRFLSISPPFLSMNQQQVDNGYGNGKLSDRVVNDKVDIFVSGVNVFFLSTSQMSAKCLENVWRTFVSLNESWRQCYLRIHSQTFVPYWDRGWSEGPSCTLIFFFILFFFLSRINLNMRTANLWDNLIISCLSWCKDFSIDVFFFSNLSLSVFDGSFFPLLLLQDIKEMIWLLVGAAIFWEHDYFEGWVRRLQVQTEVCFAWR